MFDHLLKNLSKTIHIFKSAQSAYRRDNTIDDIYTHRKDGDILSRNNAFTLKVTKMEL